MPCIERAKKNQTVWDMLSDDEKSKSNELELHSIQHELVKEVYPNILDVHAFIEKMSEAEYKAFFAKVVARFRSRKKRKLSAAGYLRSQGREEDAKKVEREVEEEEREMEKMQAQ